MPRFSWHIYKKQHDYDTNQLLNSYTPNYSDWEVITLFYSAMHYVDAAISKLRSSGLNVPEPKKHEVRNKIVVKFFKTIANDYKMLYHISRWARYEEVKIDSNILKTAISSYNNVVRNLSSIVP